MKLKCFLTGKYISRMIHSLSFPSSLSLSLFHSLIPLHKFQAIIFPLIMLLYPRKIMKKRGRERQLGEGQTFNFDDDGKIF